MCVRDASIGRAIPGWNMTSVLGQRHLRGVDGFVPKFYFGCARLAPQCPRVVATILREARMKMNQDGSTTDRDSATETLLLCSDVLLPGAHSAMHQAWKDNRTLAEVISARRRAYAAAPAAPGLTS